MNTDDPAHTDLNLGQEYDAVAEAFGYDWGRMVAIALDGVEACWLDDADKAALRDRIARAASARKGQAPRVRRHRFRPLAQVH